MQRVNAKSRKEYKKHVLVACGYNMESIWRAWEATLRQEEMSVWWEVMPTGKKAEELRFTWRKKTENV